MARSATNCLRPDLFRALTVAAGLLLTISARQAIAGGGPQNVLVVINDQSIESQEIGLYYRQRRGIPERNLVRVSVPPASAAPSYQNMTNTAFQTSIVQRIQQHIAANGLSNQIDYIVLCQDLPSRVNDNEGATAVLFYGCKHAPNYHLVGSCTMPANTESAYYKAERAFYRADSGDRTNGYLAMLLTGRTLAAVLSNVNRNASSDATRPPGTYYLRAPPGDPARNIRYKLFDNFDFHARFFKDFPACDIKEYNEVYNYHDLLGYLTGAPWYPSNVTNTFRPGAMGDHLTSYGGRLPDGLGQSTVWTWVEKGASASYGTVNEPCAYLEKFPDPLAFFWHARGFNMAESYWMSVRNPYQGLFTGDPLATPYADPPAVTITNLATNQVLSGTVHVGIQALTNSAGRPAGGVDLYLDDRFVATVTNIPPRPGNVLKVIIAGQTVPYEIAAGDTLYRAVTHLAARINASNLAVRARAYGDRLELVYTNYGYFGTGIAYSAATEPGAASELTIFAEALGAPLLESAYVAREFIALRAYDGKANTGDTVTCKITLTNGVIATNRVIAAQNETPKEVMTRLMTVINNHPDLQGTNGVFANPHSYVAVSSLPLEARRPGPEGYNLFVDYTISPVSPGSGLKPDDSFSDRFNDNAGDLTARGNILFWCGRDPLEASWSWDTTAWPNGRHTVRAVARLGAGPETQGHALIPVVVSNSAFSCRLLSPTNGESFVLGSNVFAQAAVSNESGSITQLVFYVEDKPHTVLTNAPFVTAWNTLAYGVGRVSMRALASDEAGNRAVSDAVEVDIQRSPTLDTDGDGLPDSWEQQHFGGLYVLGGTHDPDGDGFPNYEEFAAYTDPNDSNSYFRIGIETDTNRWALVSFFAATGRVYEIQYNPEPQINFNNWQVASPSPFPGLGDVTNWVDDGSQTEPPPSLATQRLYRVRVAVPNY